MAFSRDRQESNHRALLESMSTGQFWWPFFQGLPDQSQQVQEPVHRMTLGSQLGQNFLSLLQCMGRYVSSWIPWCIELNRTMPNGDIVTDIFLGL